MRLSPACVLALAATVSGCATTLSSLQTADTTDVGQVQVTGGMGYFANVGPVVSLISEGIDQADAIREAEERG